MLFFILMILIVLVGLIRGTLYWNKKEKMFTIKYQKKLYYTDDTIEWK